MKATLLRHLLGLPLLAATPLCASAQVEEVNNKVYTYVEQMPQLPGGGGNPAIVAAIQQNLKLPASARRDHVEGKVFVSFTVDANGATKDAVIKKGLTADLDKAVTKAVLTLPRFIPGRQNGHPVQVSFLVPISIYDPKPLMQPADASERWSQRQVGSSAGQGDQGRSDAYGSGNSLGREESGPVAPPAPVVSDSTLKVYTYMEQMPALPGGGGTAAVVAAIQQRLVLPADVVEGRVYVKFSVGPHGTVYNPELVKSLSASADAAVLAAVRQLPRFVPGRQNGQAVAVGFTIPVIIRSPNHVYEGREVAVRPRFPAPGLSDYLRRNLRVPAIMTTEKLRGRVGITYVVGTSGRVDSARVTRHLCGSCDAEALRLVRGLPIATPARDAAGQAIATRQHIEIPLPLPDPTAPYTATHKPLLYASEQPTLLDGTAGADIGKALEQSLVYPAVVRQENISGPVTVEFVVENDGLVRSPRITRSLCVSCDQAVLVALARLGFFTPGRQQGQPVSVQMQFVVQFNAKK